MKKVLRIVLICLLAVVCLVSCDKMLPTETTAPETTESPCPHERVLTTTTEATCDSEGFEIRECLDCGEKEETVFPVRHDYREMYDAKTGRTVSECRFCGLRGYLVRTGKSLELSGYFEGDARFTARSAFGESEVRFWVDDDLCDVVSFWDGEDAVLAADGLDKAPHSFYFDNVGENDVLIDATEMKGKLYRRGAVIVERLPAKGQTYNSVNIYVQTSDISRDYYICYCLEYEYSDVRNNYSGNSGTNRSNYRIKTAQLVKITAIGEQAVTAKNVFEVLQGGEISLAANQMNPVWSKLSPGARAVLGNGSSAHDQVGGYHGDERLKTAVLYADGEEVEIFGQSKGAVIPCSFVNFDQTTTIYAWGTSTADSFGWAVMQHSQSFLFDSNGVRNRKSIEWLDDGYETGLMFFHMFTMRRRMGNAAVCETVATYDQSGHLLGKRTIPVVLANPGDTYLGNTKATRICYSSATSGVSAETGYRILNGSVTCNQLYIMTRDLDNKLYVSFRSAKNGSHPKKGELWEVEVYYNIDYMAP